MKFLPQNVVKSEIKKYKSLILNDNYFIYDGYFVKIGLSQNPMQRLKELQTGNPHQMILLHSFQGDAELNSGIHKSFEEYNYRVVHK